MKRVLGLFLAFALILAVMVGCSQAVPDDKEINTAGSGSGIRYNEISYSIVDEDKIPEEVMDVVEQKKAEAGYEVVQVGEDQYVVITLGERNTGGYGIKVLEVADNLGKVLIKYTEEKPAKSDMVIMAITYPYIVLKVDSPLPVEVQEKVNSEQMPEEEGDVLQPETGRIGNEDGEVVDAPAPPASIRYNPINYVILEDDQLPDAVKDIVEQNKQTGGEEVYKDGDAEYLFIGLGERNTGGYEIEILEVADIEAGKVTVRYREIEPGNDSVIMAITYPYVVLKIDGNLPVDVVKEPVLTRKGADDGVVSEEAVQG